MRRWRRTVGASQLGSGCAMPETGVRPVSAPTSSWRARSRTRPISNASGHHPGNTPNRNRPAGTRPRRRCRRAREDAPRRGAADADITAECDPQDTISTSSPPRGSLAARPATSGSRGIPALSTPSGRGGPKPRSNERCFGPISLRIDLSPDPLQCR